NDPVFDRTYFVDLAPDGIADDQWSRRLESEANAARSSRENEIARLKGHGLGKLDDLLANIEDQRAGVGVLAKLAVDQRPPPQNMRVFDFISGDDARAKGTVRIE